jgi:hypothetical protein
VTPLGLVEVLLRRWYVTVAGILAILATAAFLTTRSPLYATRIEVIFLEPGASVSSAPLFGQGRELLPFVASVEERVNGGEDAVLLNTDAATLWGTGVREGTLVRMRNFGSQWSPSFPLPELVVESVGDDPEQVLERSDEALRMIQSAARELQTTAGIPDPLFVVAAPKGPLEVNPLTVPRREKARAALAATLLGAGLTVAAAAGWDRAAARRARRAGGRDTSDAPAPAEPVGPRT